MNTSEQQRFDLLYEQHLTNLTLQGKRPATIDAYSRAVRRIAAYFDACPDNLTTDDLKCYFAQLIESHSWITVKLDRNGLHYLVKIGLPARAQPKLGLTEHRQATSSLSNLNTSSTSSCQQPVAIPKKWVVDCQHIGKGLPALKYLSRYLYRGVLPDKNIISDINGQVSFEYQDSQTKATEIRTLPTVEFLWLVLQHVLPKGLRRVRDYGLLQGRCRKLRQQIQLMLAVAGALPQVVRSTSLIEVKRTLATRSCPCCHLPMRFMGIHKNNYGNGRTTSLITTT